MSDYRPISKIGQHDPDLDTLHDEIEPWMVESVRSWFEPFVCYRPTGGGPSRAYKDFIRSLERALRLRKPFDWSSGGVYVHQSVLARLSASGAFGIDCVGFAVSTLRAPHNSHVVDALNETLRSGGSAWEATPSADGWQLSRRDLRLAREAIAQIEPNSQRAHTLLSDAWGAIATRDPNPNEGYDKVVKAVEAAAHPVVQPNHGTATLGTMLGEMRANRERFTFALGDIDLVINMAERLWTTHIRHGTDVRTDHTIEEADAALHLAIPLVRFFAGGLVHRQ